MATVSTVRPPTTGRATTTEFDVVIVGAGISGIDAAYHLKTERPDTTFTVLEGRDAIGGTWSFHRYPGLRSDSDVPTFGYRFKPWTRATTISQAEHIVEYLDQTVADNRLDEHIRFGVRVVSAEFSRTRQRWTITAEHTPSGQTTRYSARFVFLGCGYYDYENPFRPEFPGEKDFHGPIVHPQLWPEDLDYTDRRVVVIGSGATAATLVPAMADETAHITMLQRSPGYYFTRPKVDRIGQVLTRLLGRRRAYPLIRRKNIAFLKTTYWLCRRFPQAMATVLITLARWQLPKGFDVDTHFTPRYDPWTERLCLIPGGSFFMGGDFFKAVRAGRASVVTDHIERFTSSGVLLQSGRELPADIIVTATGINMTPLGKIALSVDGHRVDLPNTQIYKATMLARVPNLVFAFGYAQLSWTLRVDLVCRHFIRLLDHMDARGYGMVEPIFDGRPMERKPLIDLQSNYAKRGASIFPYGGSADAGVWSVEPDYDQDSKRLCDDPIDDAALSFTAATSALRAS
ncbi:MAG TPA: NAD(P)/FAD-dependent oxidoreductase [Mycolicibacillus parakoreensis]|nr:NAD(P)/FAD-dependent oxidoreductase [Mycolicibacillus parakoreensis]